MNSGESPSSKCFSEKRMLENRIPHRKLHIGKLQLTLYGSISSQLHRGQQLPNRAVVQLEHYREVISNLVVGRWLDSEILTTPVSKCFLSSTLKLYQKPSTCLGSNRICITIFTPYFITFCFFWITLNSIGIMVIYVSESSEIVTHTKEYESKG